MDTKLKKRNPVLTFIVFFIAMNLLVISLFGGLWLVGNYGVRSIGMDYKQTAAYQDQMYGGYLIDGLHNAMNPDARMNFTVETDITISSQTEALQETQNMPHQDGSFSVTAPAEGIAREGENVVWLMQLANGEVISSTDKAQTPDEFYDMILDEMEGARNYYNPMAIVPSYSGYDHLIMVRDGTMIERIGTREGIAEHQTSLGHSKYVSWMPAEMRQMLQNPKPNDPVLCLAVKTEGLLLNNGASLYSIYYDWFASMSVLLVVGIMLGVSLLMLLGVAIKHKSLSLACAGIGRISGKLWLECKAVVLVTAAGLGFMTLDFFMWQGVGTVEVPLLALMVFWMLWVLCNDLHYNGKTLWKHNSVSTLLRFLHSLESKHPFCARLKRRLLLLICAELSLAFVALMLLLISEGGFGFFLDLFVVGLGVFLIIHYVYTYNKGIDQLSAVLDYTRQVRNGSAEQTLVLPKDSDYCEMAADLNDIHSGMAKMVDARLKSEQMKAELITNVSHDLKTPLTSIINYVDLLSKEELSPPYANDYVGILAMKSDRLKTLVQDLFEISKAQSGAIDFTPEKLNIVSLLEQTVAEMDARSGQNNLDIRFQFAQPHVLVRADGKKLHRVFENLLGNALKYSLAGTRIYVTMQSNGQHVQITFKNVAGYEMAFTEQEIVERFQRGDTARTSEGSGLGLAIAKSFLELNDGSLRVELDGDMFKAIVTLPVYQPDAPNQATPVQTPSVPTKNAPTTPAGVPAAPMPVAPGGVGQHPIAEQQPMPVTSAPEQEKTANAPLEEQSARDEAIPVFAQAVQNPSVEQVEPIAESAPLQAKEDSVSPDVPAPSSTLNPPAWVLNAPAPKELAAASAEELAPSEAFEELAAEATVTEQENKLPYEVASPFNPADAKE